MKKNLFNKKQALIRGITLELKLLSYQQGEQEILALLYGDSDMSFGAWLAEDSEWYATIKELANVGSFEDTFEDAIEDAILDVQHEVRRLYQVL